MPTSTRQAAKGAAMKVTASEHGSGLRPYDGRKLGHQVVEEGLQRVGLRDATGCCGQDEEGHAGALARDLGVGEVRRQEEERPLGSHEGLEVVDVARRGRDAGPILDVAEDVQVEPIRQVLPLLVVGDDGCAAQADELALPCGDPMLKVGPEEG